MLVLRKDLALQLTSAIKEVTDNVTKMIHLGNVPSQIISDHIFTRSTNDSYEILF
jgi:hypothetical protein